MFRLNLSAILSVSSVLASVALALGVTSGARAEDMAGTPATSALKFTVKDIKGNDVDLAQKYAGKVVLIVNTASKCGFTKQYAGLETLYKKDAGKGLVILGFPSNDFGGQEPGSEAQILEFCSTKYDVTFDMFSKVKTNGPEAAPLYKYLTSVDSGQVKPGKVGWNFEKFLIARDGKVVGRYKSGVAPTSEELNNAISAELAK